MNDKVPSTTTNGFRVLVKSAFIPKMSNLKIPQYFFSYLIRIFNESDSPATLLRRYWKITNSFGKVKIIKGKGVIGEQPTIEPGNFHAYSSFCPLITPYGFMEGYYEMLSENGELFKIKVPAFQLISPGTIN